MKYKLILIICLLASCQSYRAERKISKLKQWGYLSDSTITRYDTVRGFTHDTFIKFDTMNHIDTITTLKNGIKVVTYIKWKEREVTQIVSQKDTILEHQYTTKVLKEKSKCSWWHKFVEHFIIGVLICGAFIILFKKYS